MKKLSLAALLLALMLVMTGCASEKEAAVSLYVNVVDTYVLDESRAALAEELASALPALNTEEAALSVMAISSGDSERDPMGTVAGMAQIAGLMASGEMELLLCNAENAQRHGDSGEAYMPLNELFTAEEQAALGIRPLSVPVMDDNSEPTGEMSAPCGIDLSGSTRLTEMIGTTDLGAYVLVNSKHVDAAKTVIEHLLTLK